MWRTEPRSAEIERAEMERKKRIADGSEKYVRANSFLNVLKKYYRHGMITWQQYSTIRGQAIAGDIDGAMKGLERLMKE